MGKLKRLFGEIDKKMYRVLELDGLSDYERNKIHNSPTHFQLNLQDDGFDEVIYLREIK
jgi:hypothetical protein